MRYPNRISQTTLVSCFLVCLLVTSMACALSGNSTTIPTATLISANPANATEKAPKPANATVTSPAVSPTATTSKVPVLEIVPMQKGLASLNTYILNVRTVKRGPTANDLSDTKVTYKVNTPKKSSHIHEEILTSTAQKPTQEVDISDTYQINTLSCSVDGGNNPPSGKLKEILPIELDMNKTLAAMSDFSPVIDKPVYVAEETVNGVLSQHFRFSNTRLGKESGEVVKTNQGDVWVAKDGKYLVKYTLILEISTNSADKAQVKTMRSEMNMDLTAINQPLDIVIPPYCVKK